jgi:D-3-phosphoglycerate dehydrogenase
MPHRILFLDNNHPSLLEDLSAKGYVCDEDYESPKSEIEKKLSEYSAVIIRSRFKIDRAFIDAGKNLKCIARAGAGMENIDVEYAEKKNIRCVHAPEGNRDAVGEQAIGMLLALMNNLCRADYEVRNGKWIREGNRGYELQGKTVGVIGYGNMGSAFVERLRGFGVRVLIYDKYKKEIRPLNHATASSMEKIFEEADVLSLHIPLTAETEYLVNDEFISQFKKPIWLINTSRGKIVKTDDLVKNIESGKIRGACLDVLEYESVSFEQMETSKFPAAFHYLINSDKVILSPHIAGWTFESHEKIAKVLVEKISGVLQ